MIRVLIAEDEPPTLRRLKRMIEQADPEFVVVATAHDGEEALAHMAQVPCDVVFTDIRMPVLDGLGLMDILRGQYPDCTVVVVSGYQDFAYVSHAMRAQAMDYLLKPVTMEDLRALLGQLKGAHLKRQRERLGQQLSAQLNRPETGLFPDADTADDSVRLEVYLFCAGAMPLSDDAEMYPGSAALEGVSLEEALQAALPGFDGFAWSFMGNTPVERVLIHEAAQRPAPAIAEALAARVQARVAVPLSCACLAKGVALQTVGGAIKRLRRALAASIHIGEGTVIALMPEDAMDVPLPVDGEAVARLADLLRGGGLSPQTPFWQEMTRRINSEAWTQQRIARLFLDALTLLEIQREGALDIGQARGLVLECLGTALSMPEALEGLLGLGALSGAREEHGNAAQRAVAQEVEAYLRAHYPEHINNQTLGATFGYVPSYISLLFRKAYGVSAAEYLTGIRMDAAKRLMREQPALLMREVAEQVGFKSQHHFSRVFKKTEGMWPTSYHA